MGDQGKQGRFAVLYCWLEKSHRGSFLSKGNSKGEGPKARTSCTSVAKWERERPSQCGTRMYRTLQTMVRTLVFILPELGVGSEYLPSSLQKIQATKDLTIWPLLSFLGGRRKKLPQSFRKSMGRSLWKCHWADVRVTKPSWVCESSLSIKGT